ncbi:uncharacterized protein CDAR_239911 [Caerostris darwini]|uniref:Uncharacterized protein n=1 Tax=Caerostris darwini TaxID=1538125 RepID=A0AAV4R2B3_9ARAC|nr:uncharacterized protein CDAR_239911 [Caerostris darwini]
MAAESVFVGAGVAGKKRRSRLPSISTPPVRLPANVTSQHLLEPLALSILCYLANRSVSSYPPHPISFTLPLLCPHQHRLDSLSLSVPQRNTCSFALIGGQLRFTGLSKRTSVVSLMCS